MDNYPLYPERLPLLSSKRPLRITVAWDQSGEEAVAFAGWLARTVPARVRVVTTAPRPWSSLRGTSSKQYKRWVKKTSDQATEQIRAAMKAHVPRAAWDDHYAVFRDGKPRHELLVAEAKRFHADVILLGSKEKGAKVRFRSSSTADALLHSSPIALGLAPRGLKLSKKGVNRINYAFLDDDAQATDYGIAAAAAAAMVLDTALRIMAFCPQETYSYDDELHPGNLLVNEWNETSLALLDRSRDAVTAMAKKLDLEQLRHFEVETCVSSGDGWATVIGSQKWKKGDVLFLGSSRTQHDRVGVGQRTSDFLAHAPVPVLIFPRRS